jgi:hypothetical protein
VAARPNHSLEKRQRELAKKKKQEEKRQRKQEKKNDRPGGAPAPSSGSGELR